VFLGCEITRRPLSAIVKAQHARWIHKKAGFRLVQESSKSVEIWLRYAQSKSWSSKGCSGETHDGVEAQWRHVEPNKAMATQRGEAGSDGDLLEGVPLAIRMVWVPLCAGARVHREKAEPRRVVQNRVGENPLPS
jgi:hypothetical protein